MLRLLLIGLFPLSLFAQTQPNVLLIIADDLGVDHINGYHDGELMATTPTLDSLRETGITFTNATAAPVCSPSRAALLTAKYGVKTGVITVPGNLDPAEASLFDGLAQQTNGTYASALIGKWHLTSPATVSAPLAFGMDVYDGFLRGAPEDYYAWSRTRNGATEISNEYVTTSLTNAAISWIGDRTGPWLLWLAHAAPHTPYHVPPEGTYTIGATDSNVQKYVAMVEALDYQMGRLFAVMSPEERANTLVIFIGDNGTPGNVMQDYPTGHGKGSLYQGGIRVPLIVSGAGVTRSGVREPALVHITDLHATILEAAGADLPGGLFNSLSFRDLLGDAAATAVTRDYNYVEFGSGMNTAWAIRDQRYKLLEAENGAQEFYDLLLDSFEVNDLLPAGLSAELETVKTGLEAEAAVIRSDWSCRDHIQNGIETGVDCGTDTCGICTTSTTDLPGVEFTVYPNPCSDLLFIGARAQVQGTVVISDVSGRALLRQERLGEVDMRNFPPGIYWVEVKADGRSGRRKVVKQ